MVVEKMGIRSFKDLIVWQRSIQLVVQTYEIARLIPEWERFELASQMRRAAVSIPSNIAEGHERRSRREYAHFLSITGGSLAELETHFTVSEVVGHVGSQHLKKARDSAEAVSKMIWAIERGLRK
jgi:four helix bundle protein